MKIMENKKGDMQPNVKLNTDPFWKQFFLTLYQYIQCILL